jgi:hypothetical protein
MTPEEAVRKRILDLPAVTALVGTRVYLDLLPQTAAYPVVLVQLVSGVTDQHLRGGQRFRARVQVDAYALDKNSLDPYADVMALADAIHGDNAGSGLEGWQGELPGPPPFRVMGIQNIIRTREYEPDDARLLRQRQDYWIFFKA